MLLAGEDISYIVANGDETHPLSRMHTERNKR